MTFESPIEQTLYESLRQNLLPGIDLQTQVSVGARRVDLYIPSDRVVVIECDGRDFHDFYTDQARDLELLFSGQVHDIFHFKGTDIFHRPGDCVGEIERMLPHLFRRGAESLTLHEKQLNASAWVALDIQPVYRCWTPWGIAQFKSPRWREWFAGRHEAVHISRCLEALWTGARDHARRRRVREVSGESCEATMMNQKHEQLLAAARSATKSNPRRRAKLITLLNRIRRPDPVLAAAAYYLRLGTAPQSLWDNG